MNPPRRKNARLWLLAAIIAVGLAAVAVLVLRPAPPTFPIQLRDVTVDSGVTFRHTDGGSGKRYIVEYVSAGFATFDFDNDGLIDIYFVNGAPLEGTESGAPARNALYRNLGDFRFEECTASAGVGDSGYGVGATVADYDNDGDQDLYVSNYGRNVLYRNNGDGTFTDVTTAAGVGDGSKVSAGVAFLDLEGDGDLDLYVANYVQFDYETYQPRIVEGFHVYPGPMEFEPVQDTVYRNNGDGSFTDVTAESGVGGQVGTGMGMICADSDNDGDTDIFVLNDVAQNYYFENDGAGHFSEQSLLNALAFNGDGVALGSMGVDCADYDNDGWLDFFQTSYSGELPALFRNLGNRMFEDVTVVAQAGTASLPHVNWGVGFVDIDNDRDQDIFFANGHLQDNLASYDTASIYLAGNTLLLHGEDGTFRDVSNRCGDGLTPKLSSRGVCLEDFDNDGDVDIAISSSRESATIIRNDSQTSNHWVEVRLRGVTSNRDGVGAHVRVTTPDGLTQLREVHSGCGYQSHFGTRLHFGLGPYNTVSRLEIRWLGGETEVHENVPADQRMIVTEACEAVRESVGHQQWQSNQNAGRIR